MMSKTILIVFIGGIILGLIHAGLAYYIPPKQEKSDKNDSENLFV